MGWGSTAPPPRRAAPRRGDRAVVPPRDAGMDPSDRQKEMVRRLFDRTAGASDTVVPFFAGFGRHLVAWADPAPGQTVLYLLSSRGAVSKPAREAIDPLGTAAAVDVSPPIVAWLAADLRAVSARNVDLWMTDTERLAFPRRAFDAVLCGFALHLMPDPPGVVPSAWRVLRPGASPWSPLLPARAGERPPPGARRRGRPAIRAGREPRAVVAARPAGAAEVAPGRWPRGDRGQRGRGPGAGGGPGDLLSGGDVPRHARVRRGPAWPGAG